MSFTLDNINIFNNQFTLLYYLEDNNIDPSIITFSKENKIDINFVCFLYYIKDVHYLVTKNYNLILIDTNYINNNIINDFRGIDLQWQLSITYNNINIKVSKPYLSLDNFSTNHIVQDVFFKNTLTLMLKYFTNASINNECGDEYDCQKIYSKDIDTCNIDTILNIHDTKIFSLINQKNILDISFDKNFSKNYNFINDLTSLTMLSLHNSYFNEEFTFNLHNLKSLTLSDAFNKKLTIVMPNLRQLSFGESYDQILDPVVVPKLKQLYLGNNFNQEFIAPPLLKEIVFGKHFDKSIEQSFENCNTIEYINLSDDYKLPITNEFLKSLKSLTYFRARGKIYSNLK